MNKQELIQRITEKLGADERENKIAFEIFINKITNRLDEDSTIRIPDVGIFQLKKYLKRSPGKVNQMDKSSIQYYLLAVPFSFIDEASEILSFNVTGAREDKDVDVSPFSFSIDKPIIPLKTINKKDLLVQSSYIRLQRKFEYEVDKLFESTVSLNDFTLDFKPSELELMEIDVDASNEKLFENKYSEGGPGSIPWDFGITEDDTESLDEFEEKQVNKSKNIRDDQILDQFTIRKKTEFVDSNLNLDESAKVERTEATEDQLNIDAFYDKDEKPISGVTVEHSVKEDEEDIAVDQFSMSHFTKSAQINDEEGEESGFVESNGHFITKPVEEIVETEKSNTFFWIVITFIILLTSAGLYYYFFIVKNAENNSIEENIRHSNTSFQPPVAVDSSFQVQDTVQKRDTITTISNIQETPTDSIIRSDNKLRHVGGNIYTDGTSYTYQASSWKSKRTAEKDVQRLRALGYDAYITIRNPQSLSPWYLVRIGNYQDLQEAKNATINIK